MSSGLAASPVALLLLACLVPAATVGGAVATGGHAAIPGPAGDAQAATTPADDHRPVNTTYTVTLQANGDARWEIAAHFPIRTEAELESFRALAEAYRNGETARLGLDAFRRAATVASQATGRSMGIDAFRRTADVPEQVPGNATLTLGFTWTQFARTDGETVVVGDAFATDPEWFPGLEPNQELRIRPPQGFSVVSTTVPLQNRSLVWTGPATLDPAGISAAFASNGGTPSPTTVTTSTTPPPATEGTFPWLLVIGLVVVGAVVVGVGVLSRRPDVLPTGEGAEDEPDEQPPDEPGPDAGAEPTPSSATDAGDDGVDEELLSDEERIERLLEDRGGRMKQATIVTETGWSNAKVSQLLSAMEDEGRIDKLRIGRENLISFPDEDVTDLED